MRNNLVVIIPNINGIPHLGDCLESLRHQSVPVKTIMVDNASRDDSVAFTEEHYPEVVIIRRDKNYGFTGGVNPGLQWAIDHNYPFAALLNNDAVADRHWAKELVAYMQAHRHTGIATSKITDIHGTHLDSTGEFYTNWGLPFARGRGEPDKGQYDTQTNICAASGGASIYRTTMLKKIGLFDQDFYLYYEDVDVSLRAQLAGWHVNFVPKAVVRHHIGKTSGKIKGVTTYSTIKNLLWLAVKNVPSGVLGRMLPRLLLAHAAFFGKGIAKGNIWPAIKGLIVCYLLLPKKMAQRRRIQKHATAADSFASLVYYDLPPDAANLRKLRTLWWRLTNRKATK